jgi:V/A-type H+-transporting ATPase subunit D
VAFQRDLPATRAALIELRDELRFARDGHEFLDQKRMLLAGELLSWVAHFAELKSAFIRASDRALVALTAACARHGLEELSLIPVREAPADDVVLNQRNFLGIPLVEATLTNCAQPPVLTPENPSPEARLCAERFVDLMRAGTALAAIAASIERLLREYRRTERRTRALENVLLPELGTQLDRMSEQLEEQDLEEAVRVRLGRLQ